MSITFTSPIAHTNTRTIVEPCLCAQFAECWCDVLDAAPQGGALTDAQVAELAAEATPGCHSCGGTGLERRQEPVLPELSLCNTNAYALLRALGLLASPHGEAAVARVRQGLVRARNVSLERYTREGEELYGAPRSREDGTVELRPLRMVAGGLDLAGIHDRLNRVEAVVEAHAAAGATTICWS